MDGVLWATRHNLTSNILDAAGPRLKVISTIYSTYDNLNVTDIINRGIAVGHVPSVPAEATADLAIGLMIAASRRFYEGRLAIKNNQWYDSPQFLLGNPIQGSVVGIIGFGVTGQMIAKRLVGFDVDEILYFSRAYKNVDVYEAKFANFEEILTKSDFLFVSSPLINVTFGRIDSDAFDRMKETSVLINVAHGDLVVESALIEALECKKIFAAGIDVKTQDPLPANHPFLSLPNLSEFLQFSSF